MQNRRLAQIIESIIKGELIHLKKQMNSEATHRKSDTQPFYQMRGFNCINFSELAPVGVDTFMWNPLHFAIYFKQLGITKYFAEEAGVNVRLALHVHFE